MTEERGRREEFAPRDGDPAGAGETNLFLDVFHPLSVFESR
jgi:hypothetical protein